jgi:hypothetical protein
MRSVKLTLSGEQPGEEKKKDFRRGDFVSQQEILTRSRSWIVPMASPQESI